LFFQGKSAPDQFETKINRNIVPIKGTQGRYSSPI
ncbi:50S ribosomal protein L6, partial [Bienertia sinuspersici]